MTAWRDEEAHPLDVALGAQIRRYRKARNMSQERLAECTGVTFQQIQKYERGANRVSFSRLAMIASALDTRVSDLIGELETAHAQGGLQTFSELLSTPGASELVEAYGEIPDDGVRRRVLELVLELARFRTGREPQSAEEKAGGRPETVS